MPTARKDTHFSLLDSRKVKPYRLFFFVVKKKVRIMIGSIKYEIFPIRSVSSLLSKVLVIRKKGPLAAL